MAGRAEVTIPAAFHGERVDRVVATLTGMVRSEVAAHVTAGNVVLNGRAVRARSHRVSEGDHLELPGAEPAERRALEPDPNVAVEVVHADDHVVVVDKAAGVVVHPGSGRQRGTLVQGLLARFPELAEVGGGRGERPGIVHRLDKGTSGLMVVARSEDAYRSLVDQIQRRTVERRYLCVVWGDVASQAGLVDAPVSRGVRDPTRMAVSAGGRPARTGYHVVERLTDAGATLLECRLETGRTHQIRVHLASIGHPVVGDDRYGVARPSLAGRPFLHAHCLSFRHPASGDQVSFRSNLPAELQAVLHNARRGSLRAGEGSSEP